MHDFQSAQEVSFSSIGKFKWLSLRVIVETVGSDTGDSARGDVPI